MVDLENVIRQHESAQRRTYIMVSIGVCLVGISWAMMMNGTAFIAVMSIPIFLLFGIIVYVLLHSQMKKSRLLLNALQGHHISYQEALDTIYDGYYEIDFSGQIVLSNMSLLEIFEVTHARLSSVNIYTYFERKIGRDVRPLLDALAESSDPIKGFSWQHRLLDGSIRHLEASASLVKNSRGVAVGVRGIVRNTTGRIRAQEAIVERENQLRSLLDAIPECVIMKDGDGRWLVANNHTLRVFGLTDIDYRGKRSYEIPQYSTLYEGMVAQCDRSDDHAWETGLPVQLEQVVAQGDGDTLLFEVIKVPEFHPDGRRNRLVVIARDITERRRTEELMMKSEKLSIVGQLAAGVAHEIRNPLTSIRGFVQLLKTASNGNPEYFSIILEELLRIESIINEFLLLAKPEANRTKEADVKELIEQTIKLLGPQAVLHNVDILYTVEQIPPLLECEPNHLKQVFINLLKNAIESMNDGGNVQIIIRVEEGSISIQFIDQGCGIPQDLIERLGEPFYTTKEKGTGMGLMVTQRIIENHRGGITFNSTAGKGTCVEVRLPLSAD